MARMKDPPKRNRFPGIPPGESRFLIDYPIGVVITEDGVLRVTEGIRTADPELLELWSHRFASLAQYLETLAKIGDPE